MDYFGFLSWIFEKKKWTKSSKIWASYLGPTLRRRDPRSSEGPRQGVVEWGEWPCLGFVAVKLIFTA